MGTVGAHYAVGRRRIDQLVRPLGAEELAASVPGCPDWRVHDVVAHLTGVVDDALHGRLEGVGTDPWAAAQVERSRDIPTIELLDRWAEQAPTFESFPLPPNVVVDLVAHEQDLRGGVDLPGARDASDLVWAFGVVATDVAGRVPGLRIEAEGSAFGAEADVAAATVCGEPFELFRALLGRRSGSQIQALDWRPEPPADVGALVIFGPATFDIVE